MSLQLRLMGKSSRFNRPDRLKYITTYGKPQYVRIMGEVQRVELHRGSPRAHLLLRKVELASYYLISEYYYLFIPVSEW